MSEEKKVKYNSIINDFPDLISISGLNFFIMVIGVWALPQMLEHVQFWFALSILFSSIYLTKQIIFYIIDKYLTKNETK